MAMTLDPDDITAIADAVKALLEAGTVAMDVESLTVDDGVIFNAVTTGRSAMKVNSTDGTGLEILTGTGAGVTITGTSAAVRLDGAIGIHNNASPYATYSVSADSYNAGKAPLGAPTVGQVGYLVPFFLYTLATGVPITGATPTVTVSQDGGASFGATAGTVTEIGNGCYWFVTGAADVALANVFRFAVADSNNPTVSVRAETLFAA